MQCTVMHALYRAASRLMACYSFYIAEEVFALVSWPNEGDGKTVSVVSNVHHRIAGDLVVGEQCDVTHGKKVYTALVLRTG